ncbi:MAG: hypothetical protein LBB24_03360 [Rickettsiales bacterium]|jgi:hypothetical protein|nr:hypothetical protein [Rickettsiales bacterium]
MVDKQEKIKITIDIDRNLLEAMDSFTKYYDLTYGALIELSLNTMFSQEIRMARLKKRNKAQKTNQAEVTHLDFGAKKN